MGLDSVIMVTVGEGVAEEDSGRSDEAGCNGVGPGRCVVGTDCNDDVGQGTVETSGDEGTSGDNGGGWGVTEASGDDEAAEVVSGGGLGWGVTGISGDDDGAAGGVSGVVSGGGGGDGLGWGVTGTSGDDDGVAGEVSGVVSGEVSESGGGGGRG